MADAKIDIRDAAGTTLPVDNVTVPTGVGAVYRQRVATVPEERRTLMDYDVRVDTNPVYVGTAEPGTATSEAKWVVKYLEYDVSGRLTQVQVISGAVWDDRASLGWS